MTFNELLELDKKTKLKQAKPQRVPASPAQAQPASTKTSEAAVRTGVVRPGKHDATTPSHRDTTIPRHRGVITAATIRSVRKAVKVIGKEAATHRFTSAEKALLADIVYTYGRQGYRTSENEVVRIGVNWLIGDYQEHGRQSVLHKILKALKS
jgi:hypothetical protein